MPHQTGPFENGAQGPHDPRIVLCKISVVLHACHTCTTLCMSRFEDHSSCGSWVLPALGLAGLAGCSRHACSTVGGVFLVPRWEANYVVRDHPSCNMCGAGPSTKQLNSVSDTRSPSGLFFHLASAAVPDAWLAFTGQLRYSGAHWLGWEIDQIFPF